MVTEVIRGRGETDGEKRCVWKGADLSGRYIQPAYLGGIGGASPAPILTKCNKFISYQFDLFFLILRGITCRITTMYP